jgi:hypothetical protein
MSLLHKSRLEESVNAMSIVLLAFLAQVLSAPPALAVTQADNGIIEGVVTKLGTAEGLENVRIGLVGVPSANAMTDERGRFILRDLPPGQYTIRAQRDGYGPRTISPNAFVSRTVALGPRQRLQDVRLSLVPWGIISGRITDSAGKPLANVAVSVGRVTYPDGKRTVSFDTGLGTSRTSDLGEYRLAWLGPGNYFVRAESGSAADGPNTGRGFGGGGAFAALGLGRRGRAGTSVTLSEPAETFVRTYFPSGVAPGDARAIRVSEGTSSVANFSLLTALTVTISGKIVRGSAVGDTVVPQFILVSHGGGESDERIVANTASVIPDSSGIPFELRGIPSGTYDLYPVIRLPPNRQTRITADSDFDVRTSRNRLDVGLRNISGLQVTVHPPVSLSGRVKVVGNQPNPNLGNVTIRLRSLDGVPNAVSTVARPQRMDVTGTFTISNVAEGRYVILHSDLPAGFYIQDIQQGGRSIAGYISVGSDRVDAVEIVLASGSKTVEGTVGNIRQAEIDGGIVVLVPNSAQRSNLELFRTSSIDTRGHFAIRNAAPGEYKLFAWDNIPNGAYMNAEFLASYEDRGVPITITSGGADSITASAELIVTIP